MSFRTTLVAAAAALTLALPVLAGETTDIMIVDPYVRSSGANATSGAAFMTIMNHTGSDDRLIAATTTAAKKAELHTHKQDANGVMSMIHVRDGFAIAAGETHALVRGGDHVMLMGLTQAFEQGDIISVTLSFEHAGDIVVEIPVDQSR
jgi:copper(I)-binding protein